MASVLAKVLLSSPSLTLPACRRPQNLIIKAASCLGCISSRHFTTSDTLNEWRPKTSTKWKSYNEVLFPPQTPDEKPRPAVFIHKLFY